MAQVTSDTGGEIISSLPDASFRIQRHMMYVYLESNDTMEIVAKQIITISDGNTELEVLVTVLNVVQVKNDKNKPQMRMVLAKIKIEETETNISTTFQNKGA